MTQNSLFIRLHIYTFPKSALHGLQKSSSDASTISKVGLGGPMVLEKWGSHYKMWVWQFLSVTPLLNLGFIKC